jgi:hypothetical protein
MTESKVRRWCSECRHKELCYRHNCTSQKMTTLAEIESRDAVLALLRRAKGWLQHSDSCGDMDDYNKVPFSERCCGCGLTAFLAEVEQGVGK